MKRFFLVAIFIAFGMQFMTAQVLVGKEQVDINQLEGVQYVQLVGYNTSVFGQKLEISVDYGQKMKMFKSISIRNAEGKAMKFNSMMDALNFMEANGWEFIDYKESMVGRKMRYVYLLKRKK